MQHYYCPTWSENTIVELSESESHHIKNVVRLKIGDELTLVDGRGHKLESEIVSFSSKKVAVNIKSIVEKDAERNKLHIAISPTKSNDRIEWFIEKACEIGIGEITPIVCNRTERKKVNIDRWNKIIINACKQSKTLWFPTINQIETFDKFISNNKDNKMLMAALTDETTSIKDNTDANIIIIGPEGDFTENEMEIAIKSGVKPVTLGQNILRVETAGVVSCALWNEYNN